eukprot:UN30115
MKDNIKQIRSWLDRHPDTDGDINVNDHYIKFKIDENRADNLISTIKRNFKDDIHLVFPFYETGYFVNDHVQNNVIEQPSLPRNETFLLGSGTPDKQRAAYGIPSSMKGRRSEDNVQMVWGPGTFGIDKDEDLNMYYEYYCQSCNLDDVTYDTKNHGKNGDNFG